MEMGMIECSSVSGTGQVWALGKEGVGLFGRFMSKGFQASSLKCRHGLSKLYKVLKYSVDLLK